MERLWAYAPEVPCCVGILNTCSGISLLAVNEVRELDWVTDEEDWGVVSYHIIVAFFSVEFNGETTRITFSVCRA